MKKTITGVGHTATRYNLALKQETTAVKHKPIGYLAKGGGYDGAEVRPAKKGGKR